jgi:hypothetical protein
VREFYTGKNKMELMFDKNNPLIDEDWDLEAELFEVLEELTDEEKNFLLETEELPDCIYEAIAKITIKEAA